MTDSNRDIQLSYYTDDEKFFKDYIRDNHCIVSDLSEEEFEMLEKHKSFLLERAKHVFNSTNMTDWECAETVCKAFITAMYQAKAEEVVKYFGFNVVDGHVCKRNVFYEIVDRVGVHLRSTKVSGNEAVALLLNDYASNRIFTADLKIWLNFWLVNRVIGQLRIENSTKEN